MPLDPNKVDLEYQDLMAQTDVGHLKNGRHIKIAIHGQFYHWSSSWAQDKVILDAGCGRGNGSAILAKTAAKVVGSDIDERIVQEASLLYPLDNVEFLVMDCQQMTFQPASFDIIICNALFEYLEDVRAFMERAYQVLKPGGLFICGTKNLQLSLKKTDGSPLYNNHLQEFTPAELKAELEKYYTGVRLYGEMMKTQSESYIMDPRALKIEGLLVALDIKHRFPKSWRNYIRKLITGVDVDDITSDDFEIMENSLHKALYIIGYGAKA